MKKPSRLSKVAWVGLLCVWVFSSVIASQFVVGLIMYPILQEKLAEPAWTAVYEVISYVIALTLIILVPPLFGKKLKQKPKDTGSFTVKATREELGLRSTPTWTDIGLSLVGFIASALLAWVLTWIFTLIPGFDAEQAQDVGFSYFLSGGERAIAFLMLVVIAPIVEEIIFRGWLYGKLRARLGMVASILITSALFGLVHMQWNVGVNVFALSVVCCVLREVTGTIYAGILTHMIKNGVAFYLVYVMGF